MTRFRNSLIICSCAAALFASPGLACRIVVNKAAKYRLSNLVVDGNAHCNLSANTCAIVITRIVKGKVDHRQPIVVKIADVRVRSNPQVLATLGCEQSWLPDKSDVRGRFYLKRFPNDDIAAPFYPDLEAGIAP